MKTNYAFIDGQNLHLGTKKRALNPLNINLKKFRIYLKDKYNVEKAFYYLGFLQSENNFKEIYENIQSDGYILIFKQYNELMISHKKGNVDSDIILDIMRKIYKKENFEKVVLVTGDGDYKSLVDFLIEENKFEKILFPDIKRASSLYKKLGSEYFDHLDNIKTYII